MKMYQPHEYYRLFRALEAEGIPPAEMRFEDAPTYVNERGFFTIILEHDIPQVYHFLVWPEKRSWHNSVRLYREMRAVLIEMGYVQAVFASHNERIKTALGIVAGTKNIEPYATKNGIDYYLLRFGRSL